MLEQRSYVNQTERAESQISTTDETPESGMFEAAVISWSATHLDVPA